MNRILAWFYRFRLVRRAWWKLKRHRNEDFNDREEIQERIDIGCQSVLLPKPVYHIDHTIYLSTGTTLEGTYHRSKPKVKKE